MSDLDSATIAELAARATESKKLARKSVKRRSEYRVPEEKKRKIIEIYLEGYKYSEIAEAVGVSKATVSRVVSRSGLVRRQYVAKVMGWSTWSLGIVIPKEYVRKLGIRVGDEVIVRLEGNSIVITPKTFDLSTSILLRG